MTDNTIEFLKIKTKDQLESFENVIFNISEAKYLLNYISLIERKIQLLTKQRDRALYYVDHDNIAIEMEADFKKELEDLK